MNNYNPPRSYNLFDPKAKEPYKLSRSGIEAFIDCPRCFYLDKRLGVNQPPGYPFTLNMAVDHLLKKEFDLHRAKRAAHPLMEHYHIQAIPLQHKDFETWRKRFAGVQYHHKPTNLIITGEVDDVWVNRNQELIVVDYKATSTERETDTTEEKWDSYFRQMEIYQWLLRQIGHKVSKTGYFVYCNGRRDKEAFDAKLEFNLEIVTHEGNDKWVEKAIIDAHDCLKGEKIPPSSATCDYCKYRIAARNYEGKTVQEKLDL